mmetsp:Transcript_100256/g.184114  ORF Transcript_100256/g.184114 Transcript_100256/m.184114 type:complete len:208 (+) Transcript_100256:1528-2151(+)
MLPVNCSFMRLGWGMSAVAVELLAISKELAGKANPPPATSSLRAAGAEPVSADHSAGNGASVSGGSATAGVGSGSSGLSPRSASDCVPSVAILRISSSTSGAVSSLPPAPVVLLPRDFNAAVNALARSSLSCSARQRPSITFSSRACWMSLVVNFSFESLELIGELMGALSYRGFGVPSAYKGPWPTMRNEQFIACAVLRVARKVKR